MTLAVVPVVPVAQAAVVTSQGKAATVVGPTEGAINTNGTEGDDVIVAPIGPYGTVQGLGGDDTICLVNGLPSSVLEQSVSVRAGAGNDAITSGSPGAADRDVRATGPGRDSVPYLGAAGGSLDNGPDADRLLLTDRWTGDLAVDDVAGRAMIGDGTVLTWTAVDVFSMRASRHGIVSFVGSDRDEQLSVVGTVRDLASQSQITNGGGDDTVGLQHYLPARVDLGGGLDVLS